MAAESLALSTVPPPSTADADYEAICAAVTATARGRWFLGEFAKRNRNTDTTQVLAAIARMQTTIADERARQASQQATHEVRIELLQMARTIAQARAEAAEARPVASAQDRAVSAAGDATPDVAAAAERLRQIAWTLQACGIDLPASEQIGEIAEAILSADALRNLGEQRAQKLTAALHYLEQRIDRMLDSHRPTTSETAGPEPVVEIPSPLPGPEAALATMAVAMIAAAMKPEAGEAAEAQSEPPATVDTVGAQAAPAPHDAASQDGVFIAPEATEVPMDDDVVLTVADDPPAPVATTAPAPIAEPVEPTSAGQMPPEPDQQDSGANDNRPLMLVTEVTAPAAARPDAIAMQVDHDLDGLTADLSNNDVSDENVDHVAAVGSGQAPDAQPAPPPAPPADDSPDLPETSSRRTPVSALVASAQASRAQLSDTLAAIESELFGSTRPEAHANPSETIPAPTTPSDSPLAALMTMSDDERIALFS